MGGPVVMKGRRTPCKISLLFVPASHFNQELDEKFVFVSFVFFCSRAN